MGEDYSHAHAACLAAQLPKGARCLAAADPHLSWSDETWMLWHIERNISLLRWEFLKFEGEDDPPTAGLPYPGKALDAETWRMRFETNRQAVDEAFNMGGGDDGD